MKSIRTLLAVSALSAAAGAFAAPMPNSIVLEGKAVVPVLKTEVIRKVQGQEPVRSVEATVFEVSNQGKDIVAREIQLQDNQGQFSDRQQAIPVLKQGSVIVPTSKIELNKTLKQDGQIISQIRKLDAEGMEFKKGQEPVKRTLQLDQAQAPESGVKLSHAVLTENGAVSKDIVVLSEEE